MTDWRGHAVVQVGVPALERWVKARTEFYDARFISSDARFWHAHITVLAPLAEWDESALSEIAASTPPFDFELAEIGVFPDGCIHLRPSPDDGFRTLTRRVWAAHPEVVPFGAPVPTPHLTLQWLDDEVTLEATRDSVADLLPAAGFAAELELVWYETGNCHLIHSWALGVG